MSTWPTGVRFRPIEQWPGEPTRDRRTSSFRASWSATLDLLDRELVMLGGHNVVLQVAVTERDIRLDGYPRADARPAHPGVILSLDSPYGPLSYPCDTFHDWRDNLRAIALALEALRAVDRYGVTKRGEQYTGWKQLGGGGITSVADALRVIAELAGWQTLAAESADPAVVEACYRAAAKRVHPDAGGSTADFQRLQEAKRVLDGAR